MKKTMTFVLLIVLIFQLNTITLEASAKSNGLDMNCLNDMETGLLEDLELLPDIGDVSTLSRAQFVDVVSKLTLLRQSTADLSNIDVPFSDVPSDYWAINGIKVALSLNLISGNNLFDPEAAITFEQASKILIHLLGYEQPALAKGGFPTGYLLEGKILELFDGINASSDNFTYDVAMKMIYNSLFIPIANIDTIGEDIHYNIDDSVTISSEVFDIYKETGIVTENEDTMLDDPMSSLSEDQVTINQEKYNVGKTDAASLLGYDVEYYYHYDKTHNKKTILFIGISPENEIISVNAEDILSLSNQELIYTKKDNDKEKEVKESISPKCDVIYNGISYSKAIGLSILSDYGEITLIDNNSDGENDVLSIKSYDLYVVEKVDTKRGMIYSKNTNEVLVVDQDDPSCRINITEQGEKIEIDEITPFNILTVAKSVNDYGKTLFNITVTTNFIQGVLNEVTDDYIKMGGEKIEIAKSYIASFDKNNLGKECKFYLDIYGRIIWNDQDCQQRQYAVLLGFQIKNSLSEECEVQLLTDKNEFAVYQLADKLTLNDKVIKAKDFINQPEIKATDAPLDRQVVTYRFNSDNIITALETFGQTSSGMTGLYYRPAGRNFGGSYRLKVDSPVFSMPLINKNTVSVNKDSFAALTAKDLTIDCKYNVEFFNVENTKIADACALYYDDTMIYQPDKSSAHMVVSKVTTLLDDSEETTLCVYGYFQNKLQKFTVNQKNIKYLQRDGTEIPDATIKVGDILSYHVDRLNQLDTVKFYYKLNDKSYQNYKYSVSNTRDDSDLLAISGVVSVLNNSNELVVKYGEDENSYFACEITAQSKIYVIDKKTLDVRMGSSSDIAINDEIYMRTRIFEPLDIVVIQNER